MQTIFKGLSALAALTCAVYVTAQIAAPVNHGGGNRPQRSPGGSFTRDNVERSPIQDSLFYLICMDSNRRIRKAEKSGNESIIPKIIEVQCYYILETLSPEQQQAQIHDVWQVQSYKPNGQWDHVTAAKSGVLNILKAPAKTQRAVKALYDKFSDQISGPFIAMSQRAGARCGGDMELQHELYSAELAEYLKSHNIEAENEKICNGMQAAISQALSPAERNEWDGILAAYGRDVKKAEAGQSPIGGKS